MLVVEQFVLPAPALTTARPADSENCRQIIHETGEMCRFNRLALIALIVSLGVV